MTLVCRSMVARRDQEVAPDEALGSPATATDRPDRDSLGETGGAPGVGRFVEEVHQPGKALRIGTMVTELLAEVRNAPLDEASRHRLREIYDESIRQLASTLSPDLAEELNRMTLSSDAAASEAELRVAQAQLVGWLEGLFHGIQATLFAQEIEARLQLAHMRHGDAAENSPRTRSELLARTGNYL